MLGEHQNTYRKSLQEFIERTMAKPSIYQNSSNAIRQQALRNNYPLVQSELGEAIFAALVKVYAEHYDSQNWDINLYGEHFASFLLAQQNSPLKHRYDWYLIARIAEIEYKLIEFYYWDSNLKDHTHSEHQAQLAVLAEGSEDLIEVLASNLGRQHPWLDSKLQHSKQVALSCDKKLVARRHLSETGFHCTLGLVASQ